MDKRNTEQKRIIYAALCEADHPTATELYSLIHDRYPSVSRATVFRVLSDFAESGQIRRLELIGGGTHYDAHVRPHAHCRCVRCGKIVDLYDGDFLSAFSVRQVGGFTVRSAEVEFSGICPDCAERETPPS